MIRFDLTSTLIHLTRDADDLSAEGIFDKILKEKKLLGSDKSIRGGYKCICLSEIPISAIGQIIAQNDKQFRYGPFGFMFKKKYLFDLGARPAIYQPETDFELLSDDLKYRHVRFDYTKNDWTWEREWRFRIKELTLNPQNVTLMVKDRQKAEAIKKEKLNRLDPLAIASRGLMSSKELEWHFITLEDLGYE